MLKNFILIFSPFFCFFFLLNGLNAQELKPYNKAMIWRGFQHKWTYNHRINRIGSSVSFKDDKGYCIHYSASGLGSDSTFATTYYTYVESPKVCFKETETKCSYGLSNIQSSVTRSWRL